MALPTPLHYYAMNEGSGTATAADTGSSSVGLSSVTGTPTSVAGKNGNARAFSTTSSVIQTADDASLTMGAGYDWTVAGWMRCNVYALTPPQAIVLARTNEWFIIVRTTGGELQAGGYRNDGPGLGSVGGKNGFCDNTWRQFALRHNTATGNMALWTDGTATANFTPSTFGWKAGAVGNRLVFGNEAISLDEVAIFRSSTGGGGCLSDAQIAEHFNSGTGNFWNGTEWSAAADTVPPTLSALTVPTGGTTVTASLSKSGCTPSSGTGGFALGGTAATVSSWTISGTTLTLTLSGTVYSGEKVTLTYSRAATSNDIASAATNYLADFSAASITNNSTQVVTMTAGTASFVSSGTGGIAVSASGGTGSLAGSLSYQWERNSNGGSYSSLPGATSLNLTDATASAGTLYGYRCKQTQGSDTVATNTIIAQVYVGGALTGSRTAIIGG